MSESLEIDFIPPNDYKDYWETKDKQLIKYSDMSDMHLLNAHRLVCNWCIKYTNLCMVCNEENDIPQWVENAIEGLENELRKRNLLESEVK